MTVTFARVLILACWLWIILILLLASIDSTWEKIVRPHICEPIGRTLFGNNIQIPYTFVLVTAPTLTAAIIASLMGTNNNTVEQSAAKGRDQTHCTSLTDCFPKVLCPNMYLSRCWSRCYISVTTFFGKAWSERSGNTVAVVFVVLPCGMCFLLKASELGYDSDDLRRTMLHLSNTAGFLALLAMSAFLVAPVIRFNYIVDALAGSSWPPTKSIRLHVWAGATVIVGIVLHGIVYLLDWWLVDNHDIGFWNYFIPPLQCFELPFWRQDMHAGGHLPCHILQRNFTGVLGGVALVGLGLSSMNWVRRTSYRLFYTLHVFVTPVILLMTALHGDSFFLYLVPALILWSSTTLPVYLESRWYRKPIELISVETIATNDASGSVYSLTFQIMRRKLDAQLQAGHYLQLRVPDLSRIAHPFSIVPVPKTASDNACTVSDNTFALRIIFRATGAYTRHLGAFLTDASRVARPELQIEMPYGVPLLPRILAHRKVKLIAGGVGVTAFLSTLHEFASLDAPQQGNGDQHDLELHWFCRDGNLINYVCQQYAFHRLLDSCKNTLGIWIYNTDHRGRGEDEESAMYGDDMEVLVGSNTSSSPSVVHFQYDRQIGLARFSPVAPSSIASGTSCYDNSRRLLLLLINSLLGLCLTYLIYTNFQERHVVWTRLYAPIAVVLQEFLVVLLYVTLTEKYPTILQKSWESVPTREAFSEDEEDVSMVTGSALSTPQNPHNRKRFHHRRGRVPLVDIVDTHNTDIIFFCGPHGMYRALQKAAGNVPIHKEEFEM